MGFKIILAAFLFFTVLRQECHAGKGFGGFGNVGLINQLRSQLVVAQRQASLAAKAANTTIQNNIATAQNSIDQELKAAQNKANGATAPNAKACGNQLSASLSKVNSDEVKSCDQAAQLEAVDSQVALLAGLHAQISQVYILCPFWPPADQTTCIQDFSLGISTQITDSLDGVLTSTADAVTAAAECVDNASQEALKAISDASSAFDECVAGSAA